MSVSLVTLLTLASTVSGERGDLPGPGSIPDYTSEVGRETVNRGDTNSSIPQNDAAPATAGSQSTRPAPTMTTLTQGDKELKVIDAVQFRTRLDDLDKVIANTMNEAGASLSSLYQGTSKELQGEMQKMLGVVNLLHEDTTKRVGILANRERRLEVTMMHGQYGKCCCSRPYPAISVDESQTDVSLPQCSWSVGQKLLGDYSKMCEMDKVSYTEFLGQPKNGALEDRMLDQCGQTADWLQYTSTQVINECDMLSKKLDRDIGALSAGLGVN